MLHLWLTSKWEGDAWVDGDVRTLKQQLLLLWFTHKYVKISWKHALTSPAAERTRLIEFGYGDNASEPGHSCMGDMTRQQGSGARGPRPGGVGQLRPNTCSGRGITGEIQQNANTVHISNGIWMLRIMRQNRLNHGWMIDVKLHRSYWELTNAHQNWDKRFWDRSLFWNNTKYEGLTERAQKTWHIHTYNTNEMERGA